MYNVQTIVLVYRVLIGGGGHLDCQVLRAPQYVNPALIMEYDVPAPLLRLTDVSTMLGRLEDKTEEYQ